MPGLNSGETAAAVFVYFSAFFSKFNSTFSGSFFAAQPDLTHLLRWMSTSVPAMRLVVKRSEPSEDADRSSVCLIRRFC